MLEDFMEGFNFSVYFCSALLGFIVPIVLVLGIGVLIVAGIMTAFQREGEK